MGNKISVAAVEVVDGWVIVEAGVADVAGLVEPVKVKEEPVVKTAVPVVLGYLEVLAMVGMK